MAGSGDDPVSTRDDGWHVRLLKTNESEQGMQRIVGCAISTRHSTTLMHISCYSPATLANIAQVHDIVVSKEKKHRRLLPLSPQHPIGAPAVQESGFLAPRTPSSVWPIGRERAEGHRSLLGGRSYAKKTPNLECAFGSRSRVVGGRSTHFFNGFYFVAYPFP